MEIDNSMDPTFDPFAFSNTSPQSYVQEDLDTSGIILEDYRPSSIINDSEEDYVTEEDLLAHDPAPSGRSSISSFPASVVHHDLTPVQTFAYDGLQTPSRSRSGTPTSHSQAYKTLSLMSNRVYTTGFRNPSSVRALQMRDEFSDGEDVTPGHRRRGSRFSYSNYRSGSIHSTPGKRMSRSLQGSPTKSGSRLRKEFPLVLLHCTLLPGLISPKAKGISEDLVEAIIPEPYKKRWRALHEKTTKNSEVRERGVLIPHPKDDYQSLEERLLESLELELPRLNDGHYIGRSESRASVADSGFGSEENSSRGETTDEEGEDGRCVDCGQKLCSQKKWEIKVYAANGLMRAPAWAAAWSEMEKVDVQVSVFLPEDVRNEVESRLDAVIAQEMETQEEEKMRHEESVADDARAREIYGRPQTQDEIDGLTMPEQAPSYAIDKQMRLKEVESDPLQTHSSAQGVNLQDALVNYVRLLAQDRRNIAIVLLSILLVFYATANKNNISSTPIEELGSRSIAEHSTQETKIEYLTTTVISTSTSTSLQTSAVTEITSIPLPTTSSIPDASNTDSIMSTVIVDDQASSTTQVPHSSIISESDTVIRDTDIPSFAVNESSEDLEETDRHDTTIVEIDPESSTWTEIDSTPSTTLSESQVVGTSPTSFPSTDDVETLDLSSSKADSTEIENSELVDKSTHRPIDQEEDDTVSKDEL